MKTIAALFDVDGTLLAKQFGRGLLKYAAEFGQRRAARKYYAAIAIPYLLNKIKLFPTGVISPWTVSWLRVLIRGKTENEARTYFAYNLEYYLLPSLREEVVTRLKIHQADGHHTLIVSAQFTPSLEILAERLGIDGVVGTELAIRNDRYTGKTATPVLMGKLKNTRPRDYFSRRGLVVDWENSYAYGDSFSDSGMFNLVGHPVAVFPDKKLKLLAQSKGWEIIGMPKT